jgi:hypothetical protein
MRTGRVRALDDRRWPRIVNMVRAMSAAALMGGVVVAGFGTASSAPVSADPVRPQQDLYRDLGRRPRDQERCGLPMALPLPERHADVEYQLDVPSRRVHWPSVKRPGWGADAHWANGRWFIAFDRSDGVVCPDGTEVPTHQTYGIDAATLVGTDTMRGPSGACGKNAPVVVARPFTLTAAEHHGVPIP